jgi:hypothetical protein
MQQLPSSGLKPPILSLASAFASPKHLTPSALKNGSKHRKFRVHPPYRHTSPRHGGCRGQEGRRVGWLGRARPTFTFDTGFSLLT